MIERLPGFPEYVLAFVGGGRVVKADYDDVVVPALKSALKNHSRIRLYYETGPEVTGIDRDAIWEDISAGIESFTHWERIAVVTDIEWIKQATRFFSFLMPCPVKVFAAAESVQGKLWIIDGAPAPTGKA